MFCFIPNGCFEGIRPTGGPYYNLGHQHSSTRHPKLGAWRLANPKGKTRRMQDLYTFIQVRWIDIEHEILCINRWDVLVHVSIYIQIYSMAWYYVQLVFTERGGMSWFSLQGHRGNAKPSTNSRSNDACTGMTNLMDHCETFFSARIQKKRQRVVSLHWYAIWFRFIHTRVVLTLGNQHTNLGFLVWLQVLESPMTRTRIGEHSTWALYFWKD